MVKEKLSSKAETKGGDHVNRYEPLAGEMISETAERMIALAKETKESVTAEFNGITLTAKENQTAREIIADFDLKITKSQETYRKSPEGKRLDRESKERKEEAQRKADALMEQLPSLDFTNQEALLNWICEFQDPSDHIGVVKNQREVLKIFAEHGYQPGVNTGEAFNGEDRDNFARYIIGQALDGLKGDVGAIHQVVHRFTDDWKKKFAA